MKIINATQTAGQTDTGYKGLFTGGDGDKSISISESRLASFEAAKARAYAEFLAGGYDTTRLDIEAAFDAKIELNSIVRVTAPQKGIPRKLSADRFLVKEIEIKGDRKTITMSIKGERYD